MRDLTRFLLIFIASSFSFSAPLTLVYPEQLMIIFGDFVSIIEHILFKSLKSQSSLLTFIYSEELSNCELISLPNCPADDKTRILRFDFIFFWFSPCKNHSLYSQPKLYF